MIEIALKIDVSAALADLVNNVTNVFKDAKAIDHPVATESRPETKPVESPTASQADPEPVDEPATDVKPEPEAKPAQAVKPVTREQLRAVVSEKAKAGKRSRVLEVLNELGASSVTALDPSRYAEAFEKISAL